VTIVSVTSEFKKVEYGNYAGTRPQFYDRSSFGTLEFRKELEYYNFNFRALIDNHLYTSCKNLLRFGSVIPDFKT